MKGQGGRIAAIAIAVALSGGGAMAAPFCVPLDNGTSLCIYDDAAACSVRAANIRKNCFINPAEIKIPAGAQPYCSIDSARVMQCIYSSYDSCTANLRPGTGFCFPSVSPLEGPPEPDRGGAAVSGP